MFFASGLFGGGKFEDGGKNFGEFNGHFGEGLAVQGDLFVGHDLDELGVGKRILLTFEGGGKTTNPKGAEVTLPEATADVGVLTGVEIGFFGDLVKLMLRHAITLVGTKDLFVAGASDGSGFDSRHGGLLAYLKWSIDLIFLAIVPVTSTYFR